MTEVRILVSALETPSVTSDIVTSAGVSFFSNQRVTDLSSKIGTDSLWELVENLDNAVAQRVSFKRDPLLNTIRFEEPMTSLNVTPDEACGYIQGQWNAAYP